MNFSIAFPQRSAWVWRCARSCFSTVLLLFALFAGGNSYGKPVGLDAFRGVWSESLFAESQGDFAAAYKKIAHTSPDASLVPAWHARKAWLLLQMGKNQTAYTEYEAALKANPKFVDAQSGILVPLLNMHRWQELESRAKNLVSSQPSLYAGHYYLCLAYQQSSQWSRLATQAESALAYHPMSADFLVLLARAKDRLGDVAEAIQLYKSVLVFAPLNEEAHAYLKLYDPGKAGQ